MQARTAMQAQATSESAVEAEVPGSAPGAWKWDIRKKMWNYMEDNNIARFPRPVHHRIPNFVLAEKAADNLSKLPEFIAAACVKVNPDTPQKMVRRHVLAAGKTLLTPQPRLRTGFFSTLSAADLPEGPGSLLEACTSAGVAKWGQPSSLNDALKVDMIVVGSSAVSANGARLGKGEGFAELEYGILRWMGAIDDSTPVVTTIHDCQLLAEDIPAEKMLEHDVPVDIIVTPTQVIRTNSNIAKPCGILWHKLSPEKLSQIRILRELKERIENETGSKLPTGPSEQLPPLATRAPRQQSRSFQSSKRRKGTDMAREQ
eukprot:jgi/Chrzof1/13715/Cz08g09090.t1